MPVAESQLLAPDTHGEPASADGPKSPNDDKPVYPQVWPGFPTRHSKLLELFLGLFPGWLAIIGIIIALLLPFVQSCRDALQ
jgi:hypothetical protein